MQTLTLNPGASLVTHPDHPGYECVYTTPFRVSSTQTLTMLKYIVENITVAVWMKVFPIDSGIWHCQERWRSLAKWSLPLGTDSL